MNSPNCFPWGRFALVGGMFLLAGVFAYRNRHSDQPVHQAKKQSGVYRYTSGPYSNLMFLGLAMAVPLFLDFIISPGKIVPFLHGEWMILMNLLLMTTLLLALMPLLRRRFSARTCADLWIVPCVLFYHSEIYQHWRIGDPPFVIRLSRPVLLAVFSTWMVGFCVALLWKVLSHLRFRKRILQDAVQAEQWEYGLYAKVWQALVPPAELVYRNFYECRICRPVEAILDSRHILRSPGVSSPLTIGLRKKSTYLVLPTQAYSRDELEMILRHEIIHLLRDDVRTKLFLTLICAAGWFIPSLWFGLGMASEDLELCCDETVTEAMEPDQRREYASLLLQASGTERGFTSCLSASARGFRYRLNRVLHPNRSKVGWHTDLPVFALFFLLLGTVGIREQAGTVQTEILDKGWSVYAVQDSAQETYCIDPALAEAVEEKLQSLGLEIALWKDRHNPYSYDTEDALYSSEKRTFPTWDVHVILTRDNGEKMLLRVFPHRIVVHAGSFELDGQRCVDDSRPTVYLLADGAEMNWMKSVGQ